MSNSPDSLLFEISKSIQLFERAGFPDWYLVIDILKRASSFSDAAIEESLLHLPQKYVDALNESADICEKSGEFIVISSVERSDLTAEMERVESLLRKCRLRPRNALD